MQEAAMWIAVDSELRPAEEASVGALEGGASVGWGVFTTGAIVSARPTLLARHTQRLRRNALAARIPNADESGVWSMWSESVRHVIEANQIETGMFRLTLYARGEGRWHPHGTPRAIVSAQPCGLEATPARVWLSPYSMDAQSPLRGVKSTSYAPWHVMALEARERHCDEALYCVSQNRMLCEGARSNLFWRRGDTIFTPELGTGCLPGIARAQILDWLGGASSKWRVQEARASIDDLIQADEVLLSSATFGPRPVASVQDDAGMLWKNDGASEACAELQQRWKHMMHASST